MNIVIKASKNYHLRPETEMLIREKLVAPARLLGEGRDMAMLEVEVQEAPPEGRSSEPCRLVARLIVGDTVYHAEAVKPTPEIAADRVRAELEAEIRHSRGRARSLWKRGHAAVKEILRFGKS